jgi:serine/threonine protein kinase
VLSGSGPDLRRLGAIKLLGCKWPHTAACLQDFVLKDKIGSGSYGVVFKVIRKVDKQVYAMKEIDLQGMSRKEQEV